MLDTELTQAQSPLKHVAVIMDGNNRWAKERGLPGPAGHRAGVERIRDLLESAKEHGVDVLTLFAFSSENWRRPAKEVSALMSLFLSYLRKETAELKRKGVRLQVIGSRERFSPRLRQAIEQAEADTRDGERTLVIAADYGGQWDISQAARRLAEQVARGELTPSAITPELFADQVALADLPPPDLLIRTGGEQRISNFLLWQLAYTELYFSDRYWPDFDRVAFAEAVGDFHRRQRRFGRTSEQVADDGTPEARRA